MHAIHSDRGLKVLRTLGFSLLIGATYSTSLRAEPIDLLLTDTSSLTNVTDAEGLWQYDGGEVRLNGELIGYYSRKKRVSEGTAALNTASVEMTLFGIGATPPENITLQGSHSFNTGDEIGSVSAASSSFSPFIGTTFFYDGASDTLTLNAP